MAKEKKRFVLLRGMVVEQDRRDLKMLKVGRWNRAESGLPIREGWYDVRLDGSRTAHKVRLLCVKVGRGRVWQEPEGHPKVLSKSVVTHWRGLKECRRRI